MRTLRRGRNFSETSVTNVRWRTGGITRRDGKQGPCRKMVSQASLSTRNVGQRGKARMAVPTHSISRSAALAAAALRPDRTPGKCLASKSRP